MSLDAPAFLSAPLPLVSLLRRDLSALGGDVRPTAGWGRFLLSFWTCAPFAAVFLFRLSAACARRPGRLWRFVMNLLARMNLSLHGCDINPLADIGPGLRLPHAVGLVIGPARVGADVLLLQGVTLGVRMPGAEGDDQDAYPRLGDRVMVGAHACLLGGINVGDDAKIGAHAVVLKDVPARALAVGVPARVLPRG